MSSSEERVALLKSAVDRITKLTPEEYERETNVALDREALTPYPVTLFDQESAGLLRSKVNNFPFDARRNTYNSLAQIQLRSFYGNAVLPFYASQFPLLRERDDLTDLEVDVVLAPLLTVSVAEALRLYPRARNVIDRQRSSLDELATRSKLLVSNLESLFDWSFAYRKSALELIGLADDYDRRRGEVSGQMYSIRSKVINDELGKLVDKVKKAESNFLLAQRRHTELFRREVAERKRAIDLLTNYLSGTLLRVGGNLNQIQPRYDVSVQGTPFESKIGQLIPLYRRLRTLLIQHRLLRPLVDQIIQHVRVSPDLNKNNFLLRKYF